MIVVGIIALVGCIVLFRGQAAVPNPPSAYLTPENTAIGPNTEVKLQIRENSGSTAISATEVAINYPTDLLEYKSLDDTGSAFSIVAESSHTDGKIVVSRGLAGGVAPITGDQLVTTLVFATKANSGTANVAIIPNETFVIDATTATNILIGSGRTQGANIIVDASPPVVGLSGISNNQTIASGSSLPININTTDATGATKLDIRIDNKTVATPTIASPNYVYQWDTSGLALGNHTIQVFATDAFNNTGQSPTVTVTLADKTPPTISLPAPSTNPVRGVVTLKAVTSDSGGAGINKVEYFAGTTLISSTSTSPYQISWNTSDGRFPDGVYSLTAKAYDNANPANTAVSTPINITIENIDKTPPQTPSNLRVNSSNMTSISMAWNASTDNFGVVGYQISRNNEYLQLVKELSYTDTNLSPGTTYIYSVVAIDAGGNKSAPTTITVATTKSKIGDFNLDGKVYIEDLALFLAKWKRTDAPQFDLDKKGLVDIVDLAILLAYYGK